MQLGIFAKTFPGNDPDTVLAAARAAGYDGVQYNLACSGLTPMPDAIDQAVVTAVADAAARHRQTLFAVSGTYNMAHPDASVRERGLKRLEVIAEHCAALGTRLVTLCTGTRDTDDQWRWHRDNAGSDAWRDMRASFDAAVAIAERHDVLLGVEPELANVVSNTETAVRLLGELGSEHVRIVLDPANLFESASESERRALIDEAVDRLGAHLVMAHAKDRNASGGFATAGKGVIDFDHFVVALQRVGFDGPLVTHGLDAGEAPGVAAFLRERLGVQRT